MPTCNGDDTELKRDLITNIWTCERCSDKYIVCWRCGRNQEWTISVVDDLKESECVACHRWFCWRCWPDTGAGSHDGENYAWYCDDCVAEHTTAET